MQKIRNPIEENPRNTHGSTYTQTRKSQEPMVRSKQIVEYANRKDTENGKIESCVGSNICFRDTTIGGLTVPAS